MESGSLDKHGHGGSLGARVGVTDGGLETKIVGGLDGKGVGTTDGPYEGATTGDLLGEYDGDIVGSSVL